LVSSNSSYYRWASCFSYNKSLISFKLQQILCFTEKSSVESNHYDSETELETTDEEDNTKVNKRPQRLKGNKRYTG
jgi:hypothetical protein